jgi:glycerol-3-phosphate dehydrogenase subunit B
LLRAWAGVRPLFQETATSAENRDVTRAFALLDHVERDGVAGLITITSGKWTTYRKMAEVTADKVCQKLAIHKECRTHLEMLPVPKQKSGIRTHHHYLGARLTEIEQHHSYGNLICECELVTLSDIEQVIQKEGINTLDDIRRDLRLGMGPCQGGFCTLRAAGLLHSLRHPSVLETNTALRDFLEERWKGQLPVLWGQQLRQARLNELIYKNVLAADRLPGKPASRLASTKYAPPDTQPAPELIPEKATQPQLSTSAVLPSRRSDILVIGAGLAGLVAAWRAVQKNKRVRLIAKGWGATYWGAGCIDILDNQPLSGFIDTHPSHPYALAGMTSIQLALEDFKALCASSGYPIHGSLDKNWSLATALGTSRYTCLAPATMIAGDLRQRSPMLIVGFTQLMDFYPAYVAENLNAQSIFATDITLDLPSLQSRQFVTPVVLARLFESPAFRIEVAVALRGRLGSAARIGFPAVLGLKDPIRAIKDLEDKLGIPVFEIPGLPPSIPGMRLHALFSSAIEKLGGTVLNGMQVIGCQVQNKHIQAVWSEAASRQKYHSADTYILATGGLLGGGITLDNSGYAHDTALGLPISLPPDRASWHQDSFFTKEPHLVHSIGHSVNRQFQPLNPNGDPFYENLYAIGGSLGGFDPIHEHSLEGISLVTGHLIGERLA